MLSTNVALLGFFALNQEVMMNEQMNEFFACVVVFFNVYVYEFVCVCACKCMFRQSGEGSFLLTMVLLIMFL